MDKKIIMAIGIIAVIIFAACFATFKLGEHKQKVIAQDICRNPNSSFYCCDMNAQNCDENYCTEFYYVPKYATCSNVSITCE